MRLGRRIEDIIIIDNSPNSYIFQPLNAFPCLSWYDDKKDEELAEFIPVLNRLKKFQGDIRKILKKIVPRNMGNKVDTLRAIKVLDKALA